MKLSAISDTSGSFQELSALVFYIIDVLFTFDDARVFSLLIIAAFG